MEILEASADEVLFSVFKNKSLAYYDNNLQFHFRAISFFDERENYFRYKLEGYDDTWTAPFISKDHLIRFTNLPPGNYRFYLQTRNALGLWSDIVSTGVITINEPYWMKWWFFLFLVLIVAMPVIGTTVILYQQRYSRKLEKRVEERTAALADSERLYRTTIDSLKDAIHVIDRNFIIRLHNKRMSEWSESLNLPSDLSGKQFFEVFHFLKKKVQKEYESVFRTGKIEETEGEITINGHSIAFETKKIPIFEGEKVVSVLTVVRDLTEKKRAQEEKHRAQALLTAAIEQTPAGIVIADAPEGQVKMANSAALRILRIADKEISDLTAEFAPEKWQLFTEDGEQIKAEDFPLRQAVEKGKNVENQILVYQKDESEPQWMYVNAAPVRDKTGNVIAGVMVFQDITELKKAGDQIKESLREKDVLIKEIHHRVKNNLQVVSSLLFLQSKQITDDAAKSMFQDSRDRIKSIALVHEKMYRSESFSQVNFGEYIRSLSHSLYQVHHVDPGKVDFFLDLDDVPLSMEQAIPCGLIVNELISNALKYAFPKSVTKAKKIEVKIKAKENGIVELIVRDNGVGLPKEFDIHKTDSLGLKLVATLAENQLDGELKLNRRYGTKFTIRFKIST